ncbi:MAG: hypothetical protein DHS20C08_04770 [Rhodomicrobium sp.]|nr:MAG: hypothetical protein DHS20C08_04770 [Rhodomicrobium sp.]
MISWLAGPLGLALRYPLITGLLLVSLTGMSWSYLKGREHVAQRHQQEMREAITKDTQENKELQRAAEADQELHEKEVKEATVKQEKDIADIETLKPHQCLDVKLRDIGLR